jgi:hypothetical protein
VTRGIVHYECTSKELISVIALFGAKSLFPYKRWINDLLLRRVFTSSKIRSQCVAAFAVAHRRLIVAGSVLARMKVISDAPDMQIQIKEKLKGNPIPFSVDQAKIDPPRLK